MIDKIKRKIAGKVSNIFRSVVRSEIENALPIILQLIEFQNSAKEDRQSFYDHTKDPFGSIGFYENLKDRLLSAGVSVEPVDIDIPDLELIFTMLGEKVTTEISEQEKPDTFTDNKKVARRGGAVAGNARKETEKELGRSVVSEENYLSDKLPDNNQNKKSWGVLK